MFKVRLGAGLLAIALVVTTWINARPGAAAGMPSLDRDVDAALAKLYAGTPAARSLERRAKAILVFPSIVKAGFLLGAQYGDGALRRQGKTVGYYNTVAASYGYQAGLQAFGYVLFFMSDSALKYLDESGGFELGAGPSLVVLDAGQAAALTTTTMQSEIYAVVFDQKGLMGGVGIQGSKISRIDR
jgi:lipid-binding SYLF domain-containing protein